jgi:hypothetical protein
VHEPVDHRDPSTSLHERIISRAPDVADAVLSVREQR